MNQELKTCSTADYGNKHVKNSSFAGFEYNLPDLLPLQMGIESNSFTVWVPDKYYLILGRGNSPKNSLNLEKVIADKIPVIKRPSGGETVILSPNMIVLSAVKICEKLQNPRLFFNYFNDQIIQILQESGITDLQTKGISDIAIVDKKIVGSSIYKTGKLIFYHAVLNVAEPVSTISKYIKHPQKEPDYRVGRPHEDFVTSLINEGYKLTTSSLSEVFKNSICIEKYSFVSNSTFNYY